ADEIRNLDVGIMPLPDEPWERGKCGYKLLQYMASTRPVIASPVGANRQIVDNGTNGFLAATHSEWLHAFQILQASRELRNRLGMAGRKKVEAGYSLQSKAPVIGAILQNAIRGTE